MAGICTKKRDKPDYKMSVDWVTLREKATDLMQGLSKAGSYEARSKPGAGRGEKWKTIIVEG